MKSRARRAGTRIKPEMQLFGAQMKQLQQMHFQQLELSSLSFFLEGTSKLVVEGKPLIICGDGTGDDHLEEARDLIRIIINSPS